VLITVKLIAQSSDRLTPVTLGDAIIEPLFDSEIRNLKTWKMEGENLNVEDKFWTSVPFSYSSIKTNKAPLFSKEYQGEGIYLSDYNTLVVSMGVSKGTSIKIKAITDKGEFENTVISQNSANNQYLLANLLSIWGLSIKLQLSINQSGLMVLGANSKLEICRLVLVIHKICRLYYPNLLTPTENVPILKLLK
jgi:hypothetical protein